MKKNGLLFLAIFLAIFLTSKGLVSASMDGLGVDELTKGSDAVVQGTVEKLTPRWSEDGNKIITTAKVRVSTVVKGNDRYKNKKGGLVEVEYEGGEVGDIGYKRADVSVLNQGDNVFMFLKTGGAESPNAQTRGMRSFVAPEDMPHSIVGLGQGVYKVDRAGMARKSEFSIVSGHEKVNPSLRVEELTRMVKGVK